MQQAWNLYRVLFTFDEKQLGAKNNNLLSNDLIVEAGRESSNNMEQRRKSLTT